MLTRISAELQRVEAGSAILVTQDGQELRVPKADLAPIPEMGTAYVLQVLPEQEALLEQEVLAKLLLNQIMRNDEEAP